MNMIYYLQDIKGLRSDMKKYGGKKMKFEVVKKVDHLGRIVVPKSMREYYGIRLDSCIKFIPTEEGILIK